MNGFSEPSNSMNVTERMTARYRVRHETTYLNSRIAAGCANFLHLHPLDSLGQVVYRFHLNIDPLPSLLTSHRDAFGNLVHYLEIHRSHQRLTLLAESEVAIERPWPTADPDIAWEMIRDGLRSPTMPLWLAAAQFAYPSPRVRWCDAMTEYAAQSLQPGRSVFEAVDELAQRIHEDFVFDPEATHVKTGVAEVFARRRGVCQDLSHVLLALLRSHGLAAAYVSGYLRTEAPAGQPRLVGADASHAWISLFAGAAGWHDYDPTNNCRVHVDHIVVARGRDYDDVAPVQGVATGGGRHTLVVKVDVVNLV
jgi:transglutaminase-like putative cysteine protease